MRKRLITPTSETIRTRGEGWLDVERAAVVEVTSEDEEFPLESAFVSAGARGWRAAAPGTQTIRLIFDQPQRLRCISLVFEENETGRTQEFVLRWSSDGGSSVKELIRQQWNFTPPDSIREVEELSSGSFKRYSTRTSHQAEYRWWSRSRIAKEPPFVLTRPMLRRGIVPTSKPEITAVEFWLGVRSSTASLGVPAQWRDYPLLFLHS